MLIDRKPPLTIESQTIRAGLAIFPDVEACVAAVRPVNRYLPIRIPPIYKVVVRIAEEQIPDFAVPYGPFRELEAGGKPLNHCARCQDGIERRVLLKDVSLDSKCPIAGTGFVKIENCGLYPYKIIGTCGNRTVDPKHCQLNFLPWCRIPRDDQPVRSVITLDDRPATLAIYGRECTVDPNLGIVVDHDLKSHRGSGGLKLANLFRNRYVDSVPIEADFAGGPPGFKSSWFESLPSGIVEVGSTRVGRIVVCLDWVTRWLQIRTRRSEVSFDNSYVTVPPLPLDEFDAESGSQIDNRIWSSIWRHLRSPSLSPGRCWNQQEQEATPQHCRYISHFTPVLI